ncbi:UNVERIFIED_CONTAM: hypothetical protein GTU68_028932 [Idotea baltica]|nr:hypothetical protein [Idotea baltica]
MKIYTKTGDDGTTMLFGGGRVQKHHLRIEAYGTIDELNSNIGLIADTIELEKERAFLIEIQKELFTVGAILATNPEKKNAKPPNLNSNAIDNLEAKIDAYTAELPELKHFVLPGGDFVASYCHLARCVCRRSERRIIALNEQEAVVSAVIEYVNRLSDYLFTLARYVVLKKGKEEIKWLP